MVKVRVARGAIALDSLTGDAALAGRIKALSSGGHLLLDVGGYVGRWMRTPEGLSPADSNVRDAWQMMQVDDLIDVRLVAAEGSGLVTFGHRGQLWDTPDGQYR